MLRICCNVFSYLEKNISTFYALHQWPFSNDINLGSKRKDRKNIFSNLFGKEKDKEKKKEPNKENDEDLFDILSRVQGSR